LAMATMATKSALEVDFQKLRVETTKVETTPPGRRRG